MPGMLMYPRPKPPQGTPPSATPDPALCVSIVRSDGLTYDFTQGVFVPDPPGNSGCRNFAPVQAHQLTGWLECPLPELDPFYAYMYLVLDAKTLETVDGPQPLFDLKPSGEHVASVGPLGAFSRR